MSNDVDRLLGMNGLAAQFGCRLKPELSRLLEEWSAPLHPDVTPLPVALASSGPAYQTTTLERLAAEGIPRIGLAADPVVRDARKSV
ncbi:MAG: hypothetical protein AAF401_06150 [Pseudomonadota bacterium]